MKDQHKKYHHPLYLEHQRLTPEFDYYSLGLVLLEIGLWKLLDDMTVGYKYWSSEELKQTLRLKSTMGTSYREAVDSCLNVNGVTHHSFPLKSLDPAIPSHLKLGHEVLEALSKYPHEANGMESVIIHHILVLQCQSCVKKGSPLSSCSADLAVNVL